MEDNIHLPKAIIFVLDNNIIQEVQFNHSDEYDGFLMVLKYLVGTVHKLISSYKEKLPTKAKREFFPHIIWIAPPDHISFPDRIAHRKFGEALETTILQYDEMCVLRLKKVWDTEEN